MTEQERKLREAVERDWFNVTLTIANYVQSCRALDNFRDEQASRAAEAEIEAGRNPF